MTSCKSDWTALACYPTTLTDAVRGINVCVQRDPSGLLAVRYVLRAEMLHVRMPPAQPAARADGLWKHTCFEAIIAPGPADGGYNELKISPSRQRAINSFEAYRKGMSPTEVTAPPALAVRRFHDRLELDAAIDLSDLTGVREARTLKLAVTAVVEDDSGTLSFWALKHAPGKPDFHHQDGFVLELPP